MKGTCLKGRYLIGEVIGKGGMAVVYKAYDFRSGRTVAVKVLREQFNTDAEFVRRFQQEAEAASAVSHENLIDIYDVGEQGGSRFIVMEYVDGMTLKSLIQEHGALDNYSAITIARQICNALQSAHDAGIVHRDIKPQNILLDRKGVVKLSDFGIAKTSDTQTINDNKEEGVLGSVHYFAPEQARGETAAAASDLYSLGVVLYEMVTAKLPFTGDTPVAIALQHMSTAAVPPIEMEPKITQALNEIILKAIQKAPEDRYRSAKEFYDDLSMALVYPEGGFVQKNSDRPPVDFENAEKKEETDRSLAEKAKNKLKSVLVMKQMRVVRTVLGVACLAMVALVAVIALQLMGSRVEVPSVVGVNLEEAALRLNNAELTMKVQNTRYDDSVAPGIVLEQSPAHEAHANAGDVVSVTVSSGPEKTMLSSLFGMQLEEAQMYLEQHGLKLGSITRDATSSEERNSVIGHNPGIGEVLMNGETVDLIISDPPALREVPEVKGLAKDRAVDKITAAGLTAGDVQYGYATGYSVGDVYHQSPEPGAQIPEGEAVTIWVTEELKMYTSTYQLSLKIKEDASEINIFMEDNAIYKEIATFTRDKGTVDMELNIEAETPGEKSLIIMVNGEYIKRESVFFAEGENQ